MPQPTFAVSTHLYHDQRLSRDHLVEIAAHGFEAVEVFANRPHFDRNDTRALDELAEALRDTRLRLHSLHAPVAECLGGGARTGPLSIAAGDEKARVQAVREVVATLDVARRVRFDFLVLHLGLPRSQSPGPGDNRPDAARRSVEEIAAAAGPLGVRLALEVQPNELSSPDALVALIEDELDLPDVGICLDFGHAALMGDVLDAVEASSGHLVTTHVHDNRGRADDHLVPFDGRIEWDSALMAAQKIGYEGTWVFELASAHVPRDVLERAQRARRRFERVLGG